MTIERKDCPRCKLVMLYAFPAPHPDDAVDAVLDRFQICQGLNCSRNGRLLDVVSGTVYTLVRKENKAIQVDDKYYVGVGAWVRRLGLLKEAE